MSANDCDLTQVFFVEGSPVKRGENGVTAISLKTDGHGLSGLYDRIHVFGDNGTHLVFPAHNVEGWEQVPAKGDNA